MGDLPSYDCCGWLGVIFPLWLQYWLGVNCPAMTFVVDRVICLDMTSHGWLGAYCLDVTFVVDWVNDFCGWLGVICPCLFWGCFAQIQFLWLIGCVLPRYNFYCWPGVIYPDITFVVDRVCFAQTRLSWLTGCGLPRHDSWLTGCVLPRYDFCGWLGVFCPDPRVCWRENLNWPAHNAPLLGGKSGDGSRIPHKRGMANGRDQDSRNTLTYP